MIRNLYGRWYVRVPLKLMVTLTVSKVALDAVDYLSLGAEFGMPRIINIFNGQNPISPPIAPPYPYADTYEHMQDIKAFNKYQKTLFKGLYMNYPQFENILNDNPCRQNPDAVDQFVEYANIYRVKEYINYMFVNKLKAEGVQIPQGINQKIRELEQYKLDFLRPIIPQL